MPAGHRINRAVDKQPVSSRLGEANLRGHYSYGSKLRQAEEPYSPKTVSKALAKSEWAFSISSSTMTFPLKGALSTDMPLEVWLQPQEPHPGAVAPHAEVEEQRGRGHAREGAESVCSIRRCRTLGVKGPGQGGPRSPGCRVAARRRSSLTRRTRSAASKRDWRNIFFVQCLQELVRLSHRPCYSCAAFEQSLIQRRG